MKTIRSVRDNVHQTTRHHDHLPHGFPLEERRDLRIRERRVFQPVCRAGKTIEHHINSIHKKLNTHSRAELVKFACERGIQSFTEDEWSSIVQGAQRVRRAAAPTRNSLIELKTTGSDKPASDEPVGNMS